MVTSRGEYTTGRTTWLDVNDLLDRDKFIERTAVATKESPGDGNNVVA